MPASCRSWMTYRTDDQPPAGCCAGFSQHRLLSSMALTKVEITSFRDRLQLLRARLRGDVEDIRDGAFGNDDGESRTPTHPAELGSENYEQDFALDLIRNEQETLREIAVALKKCDEGTFGLCEGCLTDGRTRNQAAILKTRLKEIPWTRNCVECQRKSEVEN